VRSASDRFPAATLMSNYATNVPSDSLRQDGSSDPGNRGWDARGTTVRAWADEGGSHRASHQTLAAPVGNGNDMDFGQMRERPDPAASRRARTALRLVLALFAYRFSSELFKRFVLQLDTVTA
jgi:hypothetical protein